MVGRFLVGYLENYLFKRLEAVEIRRFIFRDSFLLLRKKCEVFCVYVIFFANFKREYLILKSYDHEPKNNVARR